MKRAAAYKALIEEIQQQIPGFKIAYKDDPPQGMPLWHRLVHGVARRIVPGYDKHFTTVIAPVVYLPAGQKAAYEAHAERWYETMRHEYIHLKDARDYPAWMPFSYVCFPLPVGITARGYWELRGYTQTMLARFEAGLGLDEGFMRRLEEIFCGRDYAWMMWRAAARRVLAQMKGRIERGEVRGTDPALGVWRDYVLPMFGVWGGR